MADLTELLKSKKVKEFVREKKGRPWNAGTESPDEVSARSGDKASAKPIANPSETLLKPYPKTNTPTPPRADPSPPNPTQTLAEPQQKTNRKKRDLLPRVDSNPSKTLAGSVPKPYSNPSETLAKPQQVAALDLESNTEKPYSKTYPDPNKNPIQTLAKPYPDPNKRFIYAGILSLVGLERAITIWIYDLCRMNGSKDTGQITIKLIAEAVFSKQNVTEQTLIRLRRKEVIERSGFRPGNGGWVSYLLRDNVFDDLYKLDVAGKLPRKPYSNPSETLSQTLAQTLTASPSSGSSLVSSEILKTTTSDAPFELSAAWRTVNFVALQPIGFTETHLTQIASRGRLTPDLLQSSIDAFDYDLRKNRKTEAISGSPLNFFMGIVGRGNVYAPPANYESPEDEALRKYTEAKAEQAAKREAQIYRVKELEFDEWYQRLAEETKLSLAPTFVREGATRRGAIRSHWESEIWPEHSKSIPGLTSLSADEVRKMAEESLKQGRQGNGHPS